MLVRDDTRGLTAVYMTSDWIPTDSVDTADIVKITFDDGRIAFLTPHREAKYPKQFSSDVADEFNPSEPRDPHGASILNSDPSDIE